MAMPLPNPPNSYSQVVEIQRNRTINDADTANRKKGADIELNSDRLILHAPNGSRWQITVSNTGTLGTTAL